MNTTKGSKAYGMISYAKYIFPPLPVMIEKLIFDRAYTGLHVVKNITNNTDGRTLPVYCVHCDISEAV